MQKLVWTGGPIYQCSQSDLWCAPCLPPSGSSAVTGSGPAASWLPSPTPAPGYVAALRRLFTFLPWLFIVSLSSRLLMFTLQSTPFTTQGLMAQLWVGMREMITCEARSQGFFMCVLYSESQGMGTGTLPEKVGEEYRQWEGPQGSLGPSQQALQLQCQKETNGILGLLAYMGSGRTL